MSYILDALRKAEQERHLGQAPNPITVPPPVQPSGKQLWLWLSAGLGLGLNAALLIFFLVRPPAASPPAPAASAPAPAPLSPRPQATGPAPATPARPEATAPAPIQEPPVAQPAPPRKIPAGKPAPAETSRPPAVAIPSPRPEPPPKTPSGPSVTLGPEPPPLLDALPADTRRGLPGLNLDIHVYSADAGKRFVVINGQRYREGDAIGQGAVLETVTPGGALLRKGSQRFRLSVRR